MVKSLAHPGTRSFRSTKGNSTTNLDRIVRGTLEETINNLLNAEAEQLCNAGRYKRSDNRRDYRAGHYSRKLRTKAG